MSLRDDILSAPDTPTEKVEVPEWNCTVNVKVMSGHQRNAWSSEAFDAEGNLVRDNMRSRLLVHCLVDDTGSPIFNAGEASALEGKNSTVLDRLFNVAKRLNKLGSEAVEDEAKK